MNPVPAPEADQATGFDPVRLIQTYQAGVWRYLRAMGCEAALAEDRHWWPDRTPSELLKETAGDHSWPIWQALAGGCLALERQTPVPPPTRFFTAVDGWGESDVDEVVHALERLYTDRALAADLARRGADALSRMSWERQVATLLSIVEPLF